MPGKVTKVLVTQGQAVKKGDLVLIVEAMKMESQVLAPITGAVKTLYVKEGDDVKPDETLLVVE
jgi:biotin carboxyl carrier protein